MKTDSGFRLFIALLWSLVKVYAVTAILGLAVYLAIYLSPLDHTPVGPKAAITGIVFGLMGAAFWYARYFRSFNSRSHLPLGSGSRKPGFRTPSAPRPD